MQTGYMAMPQPAQTAAEYERMKMPIGGGALMGTAGNRSEDMPDRPERPLALSIQRAHGELAQLHMAIEELERRLDAVCRPIPPASENAAKPAPEPVRSQVSEAIQSLGVGMKVAQHRIIAILERLEV